MTWKPTKPAPGPKASYPPTPAPIVAESGLPLLIALLGIVRQYTPLEEEEITELDQLLVLFATLALPPDATATQQTPYPDRQAMALREALELASYQVGRGFGEFPGNVIHYLLHHHEPEAPPTGDAVPAKDFRPVRSRQKRLGFQGALSHLLQVAVACGQQIPYHPGFAAAFVEQLWEHRYYEVAPAVQTYVAQLEVILPQDLMYLADILEEAEHQRSDQPPLLRPGIEWLRQEAAHRRQQQLTEPPLQWCGSIADMVEVFFALHQSGFVKPRAGHMSKEKIITLLTATFGAPISKPLKHLASRQKKGSGKSSCRTLDKLRKDYLAYLKIKDDQPPK